MRINAKSLLSELRAIRDAPDDARSFVAFERRPQMIAAGIRAEDIDRSDLGSKPMVEGLIRRLSGPISRQPTLEAMAVDPNPAGFVARGDQVAAALSRYDQLPQHFLDNNTEHFTRRGDDEEEVSPPSHALIDAIADIAGTESGRQMLLTALEHDLKQRFVLDPSQPSPGRAPSGVINYNPGAVERYRRGEAADAYYVAGDEHETATLGTAIDHELGHTEMARRAFGFPEPPPAVGPNGETIVTYPDEALITREVENKYRKSRSLPLRRSYSHENDVYPRGSQK